MKKKKIQGVLFDFDGLMFNTEALFLIAERELAKKYKRKFTMKTFFQMQGRLALEAMNVLIKDLNINQKPEELFQERNEIMRKLYINKLKPMPGLFELLKFLKQEKLKLAIATSSAMGRITMMDKRFNFKKFFSVIATADQVKRGKPHPDIFLKAASQLKILPENLLVLEDAYYGLLAAKAGGFQCAMVRDQYHRGQNFKKADLVVTKLNSARLLGYIKRHTKN